MNITNISLSITRKTLYIGIIIFSVFGVLFPWSILAYWRFYNVLIPIESYQLATKLIDVHSYKSSLSLHRDNDLIIDRLMHVDPATDLDYDIVLDISLVCATEHTTVVQISMGNPTNITDILEYTVMMECDKENIYRENNWWVPYNLKLWVPPVLVLPKNSVIYSVSLGVTDARTLASRLVDGGVLNITTPLSFSSFFVDAQNTFLNVNVNWKGIRWLVFHHYLISFVFGVGLFWVVSCGVCLILALFIWGTVGTKISEDKISEKTLDRRLAIKQE